ncbi:enoyl-CoA hydratase/isomerase family protein [Niveispirillum sp.]|uniref:enoyl-CoA hydratase/isomerase family protein n=1 Tax=Niveispirillum sp. TaxID=1917217 RepID=UPI001B761EAF|nr:enoyl-CoA hydratase/isomerase family protein [Niveispirillum sp.]MBP7334266.1 enoyl-CoA hydratase/isomerase family protein [Niveispirillum sp.]
MSDRSSPEAEIIHEKRDRSFWITINRPDKRNALNAVVISGLREGLRAAHADPEIRAIVITGTGDKAFCAGADLQPGKAFAPDLSRPNGDYADLLREARNATLPIVARVNGTCMAGGVGLLCMADMAVAADHALFGLPEVKVGVFPMQVLSLLQDLVPVRIMREWALTGEPFSAQEARQAGLVNHVVPQSDLDARTQWLIDRLTDKSPTAIRWGKYAMRAISAMSFDQAIAYTESQIALMPMTEDAREGITAFQEKRKPAWTGR